MFDKTAVVAALAVGAMFALTWQLISMTGVPEYMIPTPASVWRVFADDPRHWLNHAGATFGEALVGFAVAVIFATLISVIAVGHAPLRQVVTPIAIAIQATPIVAIAPLFVLWLGPGLWSKVGMAAVLCFFPMLIATLRGFDSVPPQRRHFFSLYTSSKMKLLFRLYFPSSVPYFFSGLRIAAPASVIGAIVAEYVGASSGLGYVITQSTYRLDTATLFASVILSALGSMGMFFAIVMLERTIFSRYFRTMT